MRPPAGPAALALALALLAAAGCAPLPVSDAWVRATPPDAPAAALYARIANPGAEPERLLSVETDAAAAAELHSMTLQGGLVRMRPVAGGLTVPAHGTLALQPGGAHVMLIQPRQQIRPGQSIAVTFVFERAGRVTLPVAALERAPEPLAGSDAVQGTAPAEGPGEGPATGGAGHSGPHFQIQIGVGAGVRSSR